MYEVIAVTIYFFAVLGVVLWSSKTVKSSADFIIGNRSLNSWLTAMAAHASDMSSWMFMGYPAMIFSAGLINIWIAIGLLICMWLNWRLLAPKMRVATEQLGSITLASFFEHRLQDSSGILRILSAVFCFGFYTIYVCAGFVGLGMLTESLFGIGYSWGLLFGLILVVSYVSLGGFIALAWLDLIQGIFLLSVIMIVPFVVGMEMGGWSSILEAASAKNISLSILPEFSAVGIMGMISLGLGWGLGYFGQPHIITKFMGIKNVSGIKKSSRIGMSWMLLALLAATGAGLVGIKFFENGLAQPELVFIEMVKQSFHPLLVGFILCAVIAATINVMCSQILVISSTITEDVYKRLFVKEPSSKKLLQVSRIGVLGVTIGAFIIAYAKISSIYLLVLYAWSGLGSSFGPLVLLCLYSKQINRYGAYAGIIVGGSVAAVWPMVQPKIGLPIDAMIPGFSLSFLSILVVSWATKRFESKVIANPQ